MAAKQVSLMFLMPGPHTKTALVHVLLLSLFLWTADTSNAAQKQVPRKRAAKQEQPAPPTPPATPPPPTPEQMPAVPPKVTLNNGLLTIVAENSTLSDILRAVRTETGAAVEMPSNATERVVTHLGPGVPRDVLALLLNGSHFNYVMLGSPTNPNKVDRVILTSKSGAPPEAGSVPPPRQGGIGAVAMEEPDTQAGAEAPEAPADDAAAENSANDEGQPQPPNGQQPQAKTPEQLLRELQLQQQMQQQQQQPPPQQQAPQSASPQQ